jgi:murein DD-endopeptidase MepM/ murein hydrolase activator NlpD
MQLKRFSLCMAVAVIATAGVCWGQPKAAAIAAQNKQEKTFDYPTDKKDPQTFLRSNAFNPDVGKYGITRSDRLNRPKFHEGIDILGKVGDNVYSTAKGKVVRIDNDPGGYGNLVVVEHENGLVSFYGHLSRVDKEALEKRNFLVEKGTKIGEIGRTGNAAGLPERETHLHFEIGRLKNPQLGIRPDGTIEPNVRYNGRNVEGMDPIKFITDGTREIIRPATKTNGAFERILIDNNGTETTTTLKAQVVVENNQQKITIEAQEANPAD